MGSTRRYYTYTYTYTYTDGAYPTDSRRTPGA